MVSGSLLGDYATAGSPGAPLISPSKAKELFDALDLNKPGLEPVAQAVAGGDYQKGEHLLGDYFRHRTSPAWDFGPPPTAGSKDPIAEAAAEGRITGSGIPPWHTFPDNRIDWFYNATYNAPGVTPNAGWQPMMCRMDFWNNLAAAYRSTKNERYAQAWDTQFRSFIAECPPPDFLGKDVIVKQVKLNDGYEIVQPPAWELLGVGIRMSGSWPTAFFSFLSSSRFTDEDICLFLDSCLNQARYLRQFNTPLINNRSTMEMGGLYTIGAYFPEFKEASDWRAHAVDLMQQAEKAEFLPDGVEGELSTMYHNTSLNSFLGLADLAKSTGHASDLTQDYIARLKAAFDFDLYMMTPDRRFPEFNDGISYHVAVQFKRALKYFPDQPEYQWAASDGQQGVPPAESSHEFSWAGYYVMRSGWEKDANYFVLRAGPLGTSHAHQDKLNVILWPYGRELLYNGGGATYEQSKWRDFSISTFSKNTVLVDGKPQERDRNNIDANASKSPIDARWESTPDHDFAAGVYNEGYGSPTAYLATHTRRVLFVKPDLFVIADTLAPNDQSSHTYQARWNLLTTATKLDEDTHAVTTLDPDRPNMAIVPLNMTGLDVRSVSAQTEPELLGWNVRRDTGSKPVPATTVLHTKSGPGTQSFLTLLVPIAIGASSPIKSVEVKAPGIASVTFTDGRILSITADPNPAGGLQVDETFADGHTGRQIKAGRASSH